MSIRVVAGTLKRRQLKTPPGMLTRPTAARVREALFSILGDLEGARVLDLYAGSGALGIEALSRGAAHAVFVEQERRAVSCIRDNLQSLALNTRATVLARAAERVSGADWRAAGPFDVVLCDPPWADLQAAVETLSRVAPALEPGSRVALEHSRKDQPQAAGLVCRDRRTWGDTAVSFFEPASRAQPTDRSAKRDL